MSRPVNHDREERIRSMRSAGLSYRQIEAALGIGPRTVRRAIARQTDSGGGPGEPSPRILRPITIHPDDLDSPAVRHALSVGWCLHTRDGVTRLLPPHDAPKRVPLSQYDVGRPRVGSACPEPDRRLWWYDQGIDNGRATR